MTRANQDIRKKIRDAGLRNWQIADEMGIHDCTFCRWLRHEMNDEQKEHIRSAIEKLTKDN